MKVIILFLFLALTSHAQELKLEILNGHSGGGVLAVAVSADGKFALTGSTDQTALLWDLETGKQLRRFVGHDDAVSAVQFSKDGQFVLTASWDKTARLWETATGKQIRVFVENRNGVLIGHSGKILSAAISADGRLVATASEDKTARIWDLKTGKQLFELKHAGRVNSIAFSPDSRLLLTGGEDKIARLFSTETGEVEKQFIGHTGEITSVAYSPDGKQVLTGSKDTTIRLWNKETGINLRVFQVNEESKREDILIVSFLPSGSSIFAVNTNGFRSLRTGSVHLWKINSNEEIWNMSWNSPSLAVILPDENRIIIGNGNREVWLFDRAKDKFLKVLEGNSHKIESIDISPESFSILTTVSYWNLKTGYATNLPKSNDELFTTPNIVAYSPNGRLIIVTANTRLILFNRLTLKSEMELNVEGSIKSVSFSSDGEFILIGIGKIVQLWNLKTNEKVRDFQGHNSIINQLTFSPDNKTFVTASGDGTIRLWNVETGEIKKIQKAFRSLSWSVVFSPDGKSFATASSGYDDMSKVGIGNVATANSVQLWNVETGKEIENFGGEFKLNSNKIVGFKSVAYSPDGKYIAAGSFDGKVYLRNNETKTLRKFEGHTDTVNSVKFAKDANGHLLVVSGSSDSTTRIWNAATGEEICALVTFRDGNWAVVQTRTGRYDAPNGGEIDGIQWVFGNETIALNQLKDIYYTPNLLPRLLGYNKEPLADVRPLADIKLFPEIVENNFDKTTSVLTVKLKNRGGGIGAVRVMVNDKLATEDARSDDLIAKLKANPNLAEAIVTVNLKGSAGLIANGENKIEVFTNDFDQKTQKSFVSSDPKTSARGTAVFKLGDSSNELPKPTLYAIVGGVSDYNGAQLDLNFAAKDAEAFAGALDISARRLFCPAEDLKCDKVNIKLLTTNSQDAANLPTKANFRAAFAEVAKNAKPEDILVVYLAGHGTSLNVGDAETYFFLTQESEIGSKDAVAKNPERAISNTELLNWLTQEQWRNDKKGIDARHQVLILDTCAAGAFESVLTKEKQRDLSADQIRALEKLKDRTGLQILMGSAANQSAYEASQYGQGLLTYALLEGIKGAALKNQTSVETGTLFDYAVNRVPKMDISNGTSGLQSPRVFGATSIPIGLILTKEDKDAIKILESPLPIFGRASLIQKGENDDTLELVSMFGKQLDEASNPQSRGDGSNQTTAASLVYVDERNFPGAYRVTGTYTEENGFITIEEIILKKDGKPIATLDKVSGKDAEEVTKLLLAEVLKKLPKQ